MTEIGLGLTALRRAPVSVRSLYRTVAPYYDRATPIWRDWLYRDASAAFDKKLIAYVHPGASVLDLGCGTGANLERLQKLGLPFGTYTGVDLSEDMLAVAHGKFSHMPNVRWHKVDLLSDLLPEGDFDLIVSTWVLEHIADPMKALSRAQERLKPGGKMILLFEARSKSRGEGVVDWVFGFFSTHLVTEKEYGSLPGIISAAEFPVIARAPAVLVTMSKPDDLSRGTRVY